MAPAPLPHQRFARMDRRGRGTGSASDDAPSARGMHARSANSASQASPPAPAGDLARKILGRLALTVGDQHAGAAQRRCHGAGTSGARNAVDTREPQRPSSVGGERDDGADHEDHTQPRRRVLQYATPRREHYHPERLRRRAHAPPQLGASSATATPANRHDHHERSRQRHRRRHSTHHGLSTTARRSASRRYLKQQLLGPRRVAERKRGVAERRRTSDHQIRRGQARIPASISAIPSAIAVRGASSPAAMVADAF